MQRWFAAAAMLCFAAFVGGLGVAYHEFAASQSQYSTATFPNYYESLEDLSRDAELVIVGEASSAGTPFKYHDDLLYTLTPVKVLSILKGPDDPLPSELQVVEEGGVWEDEEIRWWGAPRVAPGKRYLLFLQKPSMTDPPPKTYIPVGAFMGKFEVAAGNQLRYMGPADQVQKLQEDVAATKLNDLVERLQR